MTTQAKPTTETSSSDDSKQEITIRLEVTYTIENTRTILDATEAAKELVEKAREYGRVDGHVVFGRQKFRIS